MQSEFHNKLELFYKNNSSKDASKLLMQELGSILAKSKNDFVDLLNESGIYANKEMSNNELINLFINNICFNQKLKLGTAFLVNMHNKSMNFDGNNEVSDSSVKTAYSMLHSHFSDDNDLEDEDYANADAYEYDDSEEEHANLGGGFLSGIVEQGGNIAGKVMEGQRKKKFGATDMVEKKQEAKSQMQQAILAQQKVKVDEEAKHKESKAKTTKTVLIVSGVVLGLAIIGFVIYKIKTKGKK